MRQNYHILGDVHGNIEQLERLLVELGYERSPHAGDPYDWKAPTGFQLISVGDLVDRGPDSLACLRTLKRMTESGHARLVMGNHEWRYAQILRYELGLDPYRPTMSLSRMASHVQILGLSDAEKQDLLDFLGTLPAYLELDEGQLIVCHARWENRFRRMGDEALYAACVLGKSETVDQRGPAGRPPEILHIRDGIATLSAAGMLPERADWVRAWKGSATVVWGHQTVTPGYVTRVGNTVNVESGSFIGAALSAYFYPEGRATQVAGRNEPARQVLLRFRNVESLVFPDSLAGFVQFIHSQRIECVDEYLMFLELELERLEAPALYPALVEAHRAIYGRCFGPHEGDASLRVSTSGSTSDSIPSSTSGRGDSTGNPSRNFLKVLKPSSHAGLS